MAELARKEEKISEEELNTVIREVKKEEKATKAQSNFRDFIKAKKN